MTPDQGSRMDWVILENLWFVVSCKGVSKKKFPAFHTEGFEG